MYCVFRLCQINYYHTIPYHIRNINGPNTDPRGTPVVIEALFDFMAKYFTKEYINSQ